MTLCTFCQGIKVNTLVVYVDPEDDERSRYCYEHQPNFTALVDSARACQLCDLMLHAIYARNRDNSVPQAYKDHEESHVWLVGGTDGDHEAWLDLTHPKRLFQVDVHVGGGDMFQWVNLNITAHADDPLALSDDVIGRPLEKEVELEELFNRAREWFRNCQETHTECKPTQTALQDNELPLPTRVIDLRPENSSQELRLMETHGRPGRYAALTYCWGVSPTFTTRKETYTDRLTGFAASDLPRTIRDAVTLTAELGLRYLWVDGLCIIQGDAADWAFESSKMSEVYGNATVTISASSSPDTMTGCFLPRMPPVKAPVALQWPCSTTGEVGTMFISIRPDLVDDALETSVLNRRGWCLQERILSRRIVHCAADQIHWECQKLNISEDGSVLDRWQTMKRCLLFNSTDTDTGPRRYLRSWHKIVTEFTRRNLTHNSDRFPAIAGLGKIVQKNIGGEYWAGLWQVDMPTALLWLVEGETARTTRAQSTWRAPSWSWASTDGPVTSSAYGIHSQFLTEIEDQVQLLSYKIELLSSDPFGQVKSGFLRLRARMRNTKLGTLQPFHHQAGWTVDGGTQHPVLDDAGHQVGGVYLDSFSETPPVELRCLLICTYTRRSGSEYFFLAVQPTGKCDEYVRIGAGASTRGEFFKQGPFVDITLV